MNIDFNVEKLKKEIEEHEVLTSKFIQRSKTMLFLTVLSLTLMIIAALIQSYWSSALLFVMAFITFREYNKAIGNAEIHNGIKKFLSFILIREVTGDDSLPGFMQ